LREKCQSRWRAFCSRPASSEVKRRPQVEQRFGRVEVRSWISSGRGVLKEADVNLTGMDMGVLLVPRLVGFGGGGVKGIPRLGGVRGGGSRPEARS